jgi:hypothetical protein
VTKASTFQLDLTFFGLTATNAGQVRLALFNQIHQIVFHGKGGYDWNTIYNMPIWLRKYTFNQIKEHYDEEAKQHEDASNNRSNVAIGSDGLVKDRSLFQNQPSPSIPRPGVSPKSPTTYK